jgi:hypothetical protein
MQKLNLLRHNCESALSRILAHIQPGITVVSDLGGQFSNFQRLKAKVGGKEFAARLKCCQRAVKTSQGWANENQPL